MPEAIDIVAQRAMDVFYQNYKSNSDFFDLEDFVAHCGGVLGAAYLQQYQERRAELRQEKREEIISFDIGILLPQVLEVKKENGQLFAVLKHGVMSFPYDEQGVGIQQLFSLPNSRVAFERTTSVSQYQLQYVPACNVIFWYQEGERLWFINKSLVIPEKIKALTVPSINDPNLMVPDGMVEYVITTAAMTIKQVGQGVIVKKSDDQNPNKIIQTEANLLSLK